MALSDVILSQNNGFLPSHHILVFINDKRINYRKTQWDQRRKQNMPRRKRCSQNRANEQSNTRSNIHMKKKTTNNNSSNERGHQSGTINIIVGTLVTQTSSLYHRCKTMQRPRCTGVLRISSFTILDQSSTIFFSFLWIISLN